MVKLTVTSLLAVDPQLSQHHGHQHDAQNQGNELGRGGGTVRIGNPVPHDGELDGADDDGRDDQVACRLELQ